MGYTGPHQEGRVVASTLPFRELQRDHRTVLLPGGGRQEQRAERRVRENIYRYRVRLHPADALLPATVGRGQDARFDTGARGDHAANPAKKLYLSLQPQRNQSPEPGPVHPVRGPSQTAEPRVAPRRVPVEREHRVYRRGHQQGEPGEERRVGNIGVYGSRNRTIAKIPLITIATARRRQITKTHP